MGFRVIFTTIRLEAEKPKPEYYPENPKTIGNWESGRAKAKSKFLIPLIHFLGYTPKCLQDYPQLESHVFAYRMRHDCT